MNRGRRSRRKVLGVLGFLAILGSSFHAKADSDGLRVKPDSVTVGALFRGAQVAVEGKIPAEAEAVIEVMGKSTEERVLRKGRRWGLWMNIGEVQIQGAPSLYLVTSTNVDLLTQAQGDPLWGYQALRRRVRISGQIHEGEEGDVFQQFVKLKERDGLYGTLQNSIKVSPASGGRSAVSETFWLPTKVHPEDYRVCLSVIRQGQAVGQECAELRVNQGEFLAFLSTLAYRHGAIYGILAVLIAIAAGFVTGFLFKGKTGH